MRIHAPGIHIGKSCEGKDMKNKWSLCWIGLILSILSAPGLWAAEPTAEELAQRDQWLAAKFQGIQPEIPAQPGLIVMVNGYGSVQQNARDGQPLRIADQQFKGGIFCHANSTIVVRLPGPAKSFSAQVGIDTNGQYGGGSIIFIVKGGDKELYRSKVMQRGEPAQSVVVDLNGTAEFTLIVNDSGDNINSDQASWAHAKVTLADGKEIWLGDMPIIDTPRVPYNSEVPFSFIYGGQSSRELMKDWKLNREIKKLDAFQTQYTLIYTDLQTGLVVQCVGVAFADFPTVEWTIYLKNTSTKDSPLIENLQALDTNFTCGSKEQFVLHHNRGDDCTVNSYAVLQTDLTPGTVNKFASVNGRPTNFEWPYYNLNAAGDGIMIAIGWPGQWASQFIRDEALSLRVLGGQELTHFKLLPGEEVRTPLIALLFYQGEWIRGQNLWRKWMFAHNYPRPGGKTIEPILSLCSGLHFEGLMTNAEGEIQFIQRAIEEKMKPDYWWQDAGWYPCAGAGWPKVGTWRPDPVRFPKGLREVSDYAHKNGVKTMIWFEPERVSSDTWLSINHPEWIYGGKDGGLLKLGDPECRQWLINHIDSLITNEGIDLYRQDFNIDPLNYWRGNDTEDRQGITEIYHVMGYLAYWDALLSRHPDLLIDSCASGGRRNDLETMRRALPMLRSDYLFEPVGQQCQTYGLSFWLPYHGAPLLDIDTYMVRSMMVLGFEIDTDMRKTNLNYDLLRALVDEWKAINQYFYGDYYPLTAYSTDKADWMVWQFNRPDLEEGVVQAFRRDDNMFPVGQFPLQGLDPKGQYKLKDFDGKNDSLVSGQELMEKGIWIPIDKKPGSSIIQYQKVK